MILLRVFIRTIANNKLVLPAQMKVTIKRKLNFNSAHRLFNPDWDEAKNLEVFGKCSYPNYHGHNYTLIVSLKGEIDKETGYVYDLGKLDKLVQREICDKFDHKNLNLDVEEFKSLNPTAENIAVIIWNKLNNFFEPQFELGVTLFETEKNSVEINGY